MNELYLMHYGVGWDDDPPGRGSAAAASAPHRYRLRRSSDFIASYPKGTIRIPGAGVFYTLFCQFVQTH